MSKFVQTLTLTVFLQRPDTYFYPFFPKFLDTSQVNQPLPLTNQDASSKQGYQKLSKYRQKMTDDKDVHWEEPACNSRLRAKPLCLTPAGTLARLSVG